MRDQYAGDVSDAFKIALLSALSADDRRLGVAWYYDPGHDGRADGQHLEWRGDDAWRRLDPEMHAGLAALPERSIAALEQAPIWPDGTLFHREPTPARLGRDAWGVRKRAALADADLIFLDPDNGLGDASEKHATYDELRLSRKAGRALVFITFPNRTPHDAQLRRIRERLAADAGAESVMTLRTSASVPCGNGSPYFVPRLRWFTLVDPDAALIARVERFAKALEGIPRVRVKLDRAP